MDRIEHLERYLRTQIAAQRTGEWGVPESMDHPFVTISRQSGTGAHALAEAMVMSFEHQHDAEVFGGWRIYDRSVCEMVAKDPLFTKSLDSLIEEEYRSKANDFFHQMLRATADQTLVMERVFLVVRTIAGMGKAIIVGRGGSHVTEGMTQGVSLRLIAPESQRTDRVMGVHNMTKRAARADIRRRDSDRERMMKAHFGVDIADPFGYDMTFNAGSISRSEMSDAVAGVVRSRVTAM